MTAIETQSCLTFAVECGTVLKGIGVVAASFVLFIGSVYVLLSAIFGRWMGYLVLMVCFAGWMIIQSSLWSFGLFSQGPETKAFLGPRGAEPGWVVSDAGLTAGRERFAELAAYPEGFSTPDLTDEAAAEEALAAEGAATTYLMTEANITLDRDPFALDAVSAAQFTVDTTSFGSAADGTKLAVIEAHYTPGGPKTVLSMYYDAGSTSIYSYLFLAASVLLFAIHLPLLDRAEKKRKEFLIGGTQPAWYGPA
jgi:hypothetical protein